MCQEKGWLRIVKEGQQVPPGPWEHRPAATAHSTPSTTLRCTLLLTSYLHFTTSWLAVTVEHTTPHWWPPAGPLPSTFNQCSSPVFHICVDLHCGKCSKTHQICVPMKTELCGVWTSQQFVEKCVLYSFVCVGYTHVLLISTHTLSEQQS